MAAQHLKSTYTLHQSSRGIDGGSREERSGSDKRLGRSLRKEMGWRKVLQGQEQLNTQWKRERGARWWADGGVDELREDRAGPWISARRRTPGPRTLPPGTAGADRGWRRRKASADGQPRSSGWRWRGQRKRRLGSASQGRSGELGRYAWRWWVLEGLVLDEDGSWWRRRPLYIAQHRGTAKS
jgi:hypothetical protein